MIQFRSRLKESGLISTENFRIALFYLSSFISKILTQVGGHLKENRV